MNDELYDRWMIRDDSQVPAGFADRVMEAVRREGPPSASAKRGAVRLLTLPAVRVAACVVAGLACLYRMAAVVAVFFPR